MASSNTLPAHVPAAAPRRRLRGTTISIALFIAGTLFETIALVNIPGAVILPSTRAGSAQLTDLGTALFLVAIAAWVTVFWRLRRPLLALIAGGVLAAIGFSYVLLLIGAVGCARRRPEHIRVLGAIVGVAVGLFALREATTSWGAALPWLFAPHPDAQYEPIWIAASFIWAALSLAAAAGVVIVSRSRARAERSDERAAAEHRRADELTEQMVRQAERERIARDMHDALAHRLSVVSLHAGALEVASADSDTAQMVHTVREQARAALQDMRGLIGDLRTGPGQPPSAPATMRAIGALLTDLRAARVPITAHVVLESPERASAMLDGAVYRIVQEAMTNALKHASGAPVDLFLQADPASGVRIRVVNPLRPGAASAPGGGHGALGIRERASALEGTAWIGPHDGSFIVDVTLPWVEHG
ncbi:sensor histidine kinase [Microbacterium alcoholitolerans]|uniref:sensor histidine kinase n=1 Tax=unclassified Microbacterium TaxID=2609290 RepID=UPI003D1780EF